MDNNDENKLFIKEAAEQENLSKEKKLLRNFMRHYRNILNSNNISPKDFSGLLKKYSKKENAPEGSTYYGIFNKKDFYKLLKFLYKSIGLGDKGKCRCIRDRANYSEKNEIFTYFAIKYPLLMKNVGVIFNSEKLRYKLFKKDILIEKWNSYVDEIQGELPWEDIDDVHAEMQPIPQTNENTQSNNYSNPVVNENQPIIETANIIIPNPQNQIPQENESGSNFAQNSDIGGNANQMPMSNNFTNYSNSPLNVTIDGNVEIQHELFPEMFNNQLPSDPTDIHFGHDIGQADDDFILW